MLNDFGSLSVRAYTAGGALPVSDAVVRIIGAEEENREIAYSLKTDEDGITERVKLPTPSANLSQSPNPSALPYALYNIEITAPGYITKRIYNAPVFAGINSSQLFNMIPESDYYANEYQPSEYSITIPDNSHLN